MRKKQFKKRMGMFVVCAMFILTFGMVANASYVTVTSTELIPVGTSGSQWKTRAEGKSTNVKGYLQAAIRLGSNEGWSWGEVDTGNKQILIAYSRGRVGSPSKLQMKTDHN